jgi:hypothetical protein
MLAPDVLSFALSCLHRLLAWQDLDHQTNWEALFVFGIPDPERPLGQRSIALMLDQPFQIDLLAIFPFKAHLVITSPMPSECSLLFSLLHTRSQRLACLSDGDIASLQIKMAQSFGSRTIAYLNMS